MNLRGISIQVFTFITCFTFVVIGAKDSYYEGSSQFDIVLSSILTKTVAQLSVNKHVKRAINSLQKELQSEDKKIEKPQVRIKKSAPNDIEDLLNTVESFFQDEGAKKSSGNKRDSKEKSEISKFFADFQFFHSEIQGSVVNMERIKRLFFRGFTLMSSRPEIMKNVARTIEDFKILPPEVTGMVDIEKVLDVVSKLVAFWNSPMGQQMIKPMLANTIKTLVDSNLDMNSIKPTVDLIMTTTLDANTRNQVKPYVDLFFSFTSNLIGGLKTAGYGNLLKGFRLKKLLKFADETYLEFMIGMMNILQVALERTQSTLLDLDTVVAVTGRYGRIPGTMDKKFKVGGDDADNDPVVKVNLIATRIRGALVVVKQSKVAILAWEPYPLQHPSLAIEAFKNAIVALEVGDRTLREIWPLRGYLETHPAVKENSNIRLEVAQVKNRLKREIDKMHKLEVLMQDLRNMNSIFDVIYIYKDLRALLYGQPKFSLLLTILDLFSNELENMKEIQYADYNY